jgi:glycosyltransferase involved in cell wall biosynthesis
VMSNYGLEGAGSDWGGIKVFARGAEAYSNDVAPAQMQEWHQQHPDTKPLLITLYDVWVFKGPQWDNWPIVSWVPIDHAPCPPQVAAWCARDNVTPFAMSKFGQKALADLGIESIYVPHAVDTKVFKPTLHLVDADGSAITGRQLMNVTDDQFVVMFGAANKGVYPTRKAFAENLIAFKMFAERHDDAVIYLHTEAHGAMGGINLADLLDAVALRKDQVRIVDQYAYRAPLGADYLAACYTAADVFLACSKGEGFGIHVPEAQACGTPVIVSDFTAQPELVGDGWVVDGQPDWDPMQRSWWITPNIGTIVEALEAAYQRKRGTSHRAVEWAQALDCDRVFDEFWRPALRAVTA